MNSTQFPFYLPLALSHIPPPHISELHVLTSSTRTFSTVICFERPILIKIREVGLIANGETVDPLQIQTINLCNLWSDFQPVLRVKVQPKASVITAYNAEENYVKKDKTCARTHDTFQSGIYIQVPGLALWSHICIYFLNATTLNRRSKL
jgi:hypothetical protein